MENHRTDGHIVRLIKMVLDKAEQGADFPGDFDTEEANGRRTRRAYGDELSMDNNHSLGWLLLTLNEADSARLFGERLLKLGYLSSYGWKDEAQYVLDHQHLEDWMALAAVEPRCRGVVPARWVAGFQAEDLRDYQMAFSRDGKWFAAAGRGRGRVWSTADWSVEGSFAAIEPGPGISFSADGQSLFVSGGWAKGEVDQWDWRAGKILQRFSGNEQGITALELSPDGQRLLTSSNGSIGLSLLFDVKTAKVLQRRKGQVWQSPFRWGGDGEHFVAREDGREWYVGKTGSSERKKLAWQPIDPVLEGERVWSLEESPQEPPQAGREKHAAKTPAAERDAEKSATDTFRNPFEAERSEADSSEADPIGDDPFEDEPVKNRPIRRSLPRPSFTDELEDPFAGPSTAEKSNQISVLRLRQSVEKLDVLQERALPFKATDLLASDDKKLLVAANRRQVATFSLPEGTPAGQWKIPVKRRGGDPFPDSERRYFHLSPDGKRLAVGTYSGYPRLFEARTGRPIALGAGHSDRISTIDFVDETTLRTSDEEGQARRWNAADGARLPSLATDTNSLPSPPGRFQSRDYRFVDEQGRTWQFIGQDGGKYDLYTAFEVRVSERGFEPSDNRDDKPDQRTKVLGVVEPKWGQYEWLGLVPGGEYFHIGAQVFSRKDLTPVSAVNVSGDFEQIAFSADGRRYALLTSDVEIRSGARWGVQHRHRLSQRVRVHDTRSGKLLFSAAAPANTRLLALSPTAQRVATVDDMESVTVWPVAAE